MEVRELMSGIAVVIDDAIDGDLSGEENADQATDLIGSIVTWFEREWDLPFVQLDSLPRSALWPNLLQATSFVILDWRLWGRGGDALKAETIRNIKEFLVSAKENLVPVFIFTYEDPSRVRQELFGDDWQDSTSDQNFVFVGRKDELWSDGSVDISILENWVYGNASVYALKTWGQVLSRARNELFRGMCGKSVEWPRAFWKEYVADGAEPSASLTGLINDSLTGRMRTDAFEEARLGGDYEDVSGEELRGLIAETSFRRAEFLPKDEIRCGDLFKGTGGKYWLNLRPDCDCIPRNEQQVGNIEVHCIRGKKAGPKKLKKDYNPKTGQFNERVFESIAFAIYDGNSYVFDFRKVKVLKFSDVRRDRIGRLLHPYLTRIQQRYALYTQRQALPRVPEAAVPKPQSEASQD